MMGMVSEVEKRAWLSAATVGLNPIVYGSGSNLKLAEYVLNGLGVVSTNFGVRGWNWQPNKEYVLIQPNAYGVSEGLNRFESWVNQQTHPIDSILSEQVRKLDWTSIGSSISPFLIEKLRSD